jgi:hypothetical protein
MHKDAGMSESTIGRPLLRFVAPARMGMQVGRIPMIPQPFKEGGRGVGELRSKHLDLWAGTGLLHFSVFRVSTSR